MQRILASTRPSTSTYATTIAGALLGMILAVCTVASAFFG